MYALEPEVRAQCVEFLEEDGDAPVDVLRRLRPSAPELVVEHDRPLVREPLERREVVVRRPGPAVQGDERRPAAVPADAVPGPPDRPLEVALHVGVSVERRCYPVRACPLSSVGRAPPW